jgi:hypothetical protein
MCGLSSSLNTFKDVGIISRYKEHVRFIDTHIDITGKVRVAIELCIYIGKASVRICRKPTILKLGFRDFPHTLSQIPG